jgi:hypothetical protein
MLFPKRKLAKEMLKDRSRAKNLEIIKNAKPVLTDTMYERSEPVSIQDGSKYDPNLGVAALWMLIAERKRIKKAIPRGMNGALIENGDLMASEFEALDKHLSAGGEPPKIWMWEKP